MDDQFEAFQAAVRARGAAPTPTDAPADDGFAAFQAAVKARSQPQTVIPPLDSGITREQRLEMLKQGEPSVLGMLKDIGAQGAQTFVGDLQEGAQQMKQFANPQPLLARDVNAKPNVDVNLPPVAQGALGVLNAGPAALGKMEGTLRLQTTGSPAIAAVTDAGMQLAAQVGAAHGLPKVKGLPEVEKPGGAPPGPPGAQPGAPPQPGAGQAAPPAQPAPPASPAPPVMPDAPKPPAPAPPVTPEAMPTKPRLRWNPETQNWDPVKPKDVTLQSAVIPGAKEFLEQDIKPGVEKAVDFTKESTSQVKALFSPKSMSYEARETGESLTKWTSRAQEAMRQREQVRAQMVGHAAQWTPAEATDFWQRADVRAPQADPNKEKIAQSLYGILDDQTRQMKEIPGAMKNFMEDYFPRLYKNVPEAEKFFGKRSLEGPKGFTRSRKHADLMDSLSAAHAAGLEPISQNPVEMAFMAMDNQDKYIAGQRFFQDLKDKGYVKFVKPGQRTPAGMSEIDDKIARPHYPYKGREDLDVPTMFVPAGKYVAPESVSRIINNYTRPGFGQSALFRGFRTSSGTLNMLELGASAFHVATEAVTASASDVARAIKLVGNGRPVEAVGPALKGITGTSLAADVMKGGKLFKYANNENFRVANPELAKYYQNYIDSGANFRQSSQFRSRLWESSMKHFKDGDVIGGAWRLPFAAIERSTAPIFDYIIPRAKAGAHMDLMRDWMEAHPGASDAEAVRAANNITDSIDNRFGMVNYDRWNLDRRVRDLWFTALRAPGWTLGNIREFGGGAADLARGRLTDKAAFTLALPVTAGWYTALYQYAKTGEWPDLAGPLSKGDMAGAVRNLLTAHTGRTNADGSKETVVIPGLHKDMLSAGFNVVNPMAQGDPIGALQGAGRFGQAKLSPWFNIATNVYANKSFYGTEIVDRSKGVPGQIGDMAKFMATQTEPFSGQTMQRRMETVSGKPTGITDLPAAMREHPIEALESAAGIQPASKVISQTEMERFLSGKLGSGAPMTEKKYQEGQQKRAAELALRQGDPAAARAAMPEGQFTKGDRTRVSHESMMTPQQQLYSRSSIENLIKAIPLATAEEKPELLRALQMKTSNPQSRRGIPADDVRGVISEIRKLQDDVEKNRAKGKGLSWSEMAQKFAMAKRSGDNDAWREIRQQVNKRINSKLGLPTLGMNPQDYQRYLPMIVEALKPEPEPTSSESLRS